MRKEIIDALKGNPDLTSLLASGADSIYYGYSEDSGTYPVVVLTIIDDVPDTHADNEEVYGIIRFQVTIITVDAEYDEIERQVKLSMKDIGAMRSICTEFKENNLFYRAIQFRIGNYQGSDHNE